MTTRKNVSEKNTTSKIATVEFLKPLFEAKTKLDDINQSFVDASYSGILQDGKIPLKDIESTVLNVGIEQGFILNDKSLLVETNKILESLDKIPSTYFGLIKIASTLNESIYNSIDEIMLSFKAKLGDEMPVKGKGYFSENSILGQCYNILFSIDSLDEETFKQKVYQLKRKEKGIDIPISNVQLSKYYKDMVNHIHSVQAVIEKHGIDNFNSFYQ